MRDNNRMQFSQGVVAFHKSSHSDGGGNCVEVATVTVEATVSGKVAATFDVRAVRDSKNPDDSVQWYTTDEWAAFVRGVKDGEFD